MQIILAVYPASRTTRLTNDANDSVNAKRYAAPLLAGCFFPHGIGYLTALVRRQKIGLCFQASIFFKEIDLLFHKNKSNNHRLPNTLLLSLLLLLLFFFF